MILLYVFSTVICSVALGILFVRYSIVGKSRRACAFIGMSATPFLYVLWTLLVVLIFRNGISRFVYILPLPIIGTVVICYYLFKMNYKIGKTLISFLRGGVENFKKSGFLVKTVNIILVSSFIISIAVWFKYCYRLSISTDFVVSDTLEYFHKGAYFANHRDLSALSYINGIPNGSGVADHHFPSYTAFLSYSFMHTMADIIGFPHHEVPLIATFFMVFFLIFSMMGLYCVYDDEGLHYLGVPTLLFLSRPFIVDVFNSPRDVFRICAYFIFLTLIINYINIEKIQLMDVILITTFSFVGASAHVLNCVLVLLTLVAYGIFCFVKMWKEHSYNRLFPCLIVSSCMMVGTLISFFGNIANYTTSGKWSAVRLDFSDYDFYEAYIAHNNSNNEIIPLLSRYSKELYFHDSWLGVILACVFVTSLVYLHINKERRDKYIFIVLVIIMMGLPLSGIIDSERFYRFSYYFAKIPRYVLPFIIMLIFYFWLFIWKYLFPHVPFGDMSFIYKFKMIITVTVVLGVCISSLRNICDVWNRSNEYRIGNVGIYEQYEGLISRFHDYDKRILTNQQLGYVMGDNTLLYTAPAAKLIYSVSDQKDEEKAFKRLNIGAVVLKGNSSESATSVLPWYEYVSSFPCEIVNGYEVYYLE